MVELSTASAWSKFHWFGSLTFLEHSNLFLIILLPFSFSVMGDFFFFFEIIMLNMIFYEPVVL